MSAIEVYDVAGPAGGAYGVGVTRYGAVWSTLVHAGEVVRKAPGGGFSRFALGEGAQPAQVAAAGDDSVWVTDGARDRVLLLGPDGTLREIAAPTPRAQPFGIVSLDDG